jgi:hypothetical protein
MLPSLSWSNTWLSYSWRLLLEGICWFWFPNTDGADSRFWQQHYIVLCFVHFCFRPSAIKLILLCSIHFQHHLPLYDWHFTNICFASAINGLSRFNYVFDFTNTYLSLFTPNPQSPCVNDNIPLSSDDNECCRNDIIDCDKKINLNIFYLRVFTIYCESANVRSSHATEASWIELSSIPSLFMYYILAVLRNAGHTRGADTWIRHTFTNQSGTNSAERL